MPLMQNYVMERTFHPTEKKTVEKDGSVIMTFETNQIVQSLKWIFSFGDNVKVLEPPKLMKSIKYEAEALWNVYRNK